MNNPWLRLTISLLKIAVPLAIIGWLLWRIDLEQWQTLSSQPKDYGLLVSAIGIASLAVVISMLRWGILVRCNGIRLTYIEALRLGAIGFLLSFVSVGSVGGDLFKAIFLAKRSPGKRVEAVASVAVDRAVGLYCLIIIVVAVLLVSPPRDNSDLRQISYWAAGLAILGTGVLAVLIVGGRFVDRLLRWAGKLRFVGPIVHQIADPIRVFHTHPIHFLIAIGMGLAVHVLLSVSLYLIARGLYSDAPSFTEHLIIVPIGMLISALPLSPAGIGLLEAAIEWLYIVVPQTPTEASGTLVALVYEIVKIILALAGVVFYWSSGREVKESISEAETIDPTQSPIPQPTLQDH